MIDSSVIVFSLFMRGLCSPSLEVSLDRRPNRQCAVSHMTGSQDRRADPSLGFGGWDRLVPFGSSMGASMRAFERTPSAVAEQHAVKSLAAVPVFNPVAVALVQPTRRAEPPNRMLHKAGKQRRERWVELPRID